ncbi:testis-expressed protein 47-like isoform X2 [Anguilla rostrata]|uniref:testis-expressed protein 47-like isoform X2 n=1 Tax=Anguilla rostrata TaxID=7938 RepID=UPI0030CD0044
MASSVGHDMSSTISSLGQYFNHNKNSLFEVEKQKNHYKLNFIHRLVYVARTKENPTIEDKRGEIVEYYEKFLSTFLKNMFMDGVTGLLLLYHNCVIHLLESTAEVQTDILKDLSTMEETSGALMRDIRILVISHCIENRMFPSWRYRLLNPCLQDPELQSQPVEVLVLDSLTLVYRLCVHLLNRSESFTEEDEEEHDLLVDEGVVMYLCQSTMLRSPSTFLEAYDKPVNILPDSEIVCPAPRRLYW